MNIDVIPLRAFRDNYIWCLRGGPHVAVVDPGDAAPVRDYLRQSGTSLCAILATHHHADHVGGIDELAVEYNAPVFGPARETIPRLSRGLSEGDIVSIPELHLRFEVLDVPGHTAGHIAFVSGDMLFCGDTLFSAGCGRLFEGTPDQMLSSLMKLAALPPATRVYCTHEYTASNLRFAQAADPGNPAVASRASEVAAMLAEGRPSLPSTLGAELTFNPFLRTDQPSVVTAASRHAGQTLQDSVSVLATLRAWKNTF